jgi:hypothetical protein
MEIHQKTLTSFFTMKTASTQKNDPQVNCRGKVEIFEYRIRFSTAFVVFDIFNRKVVQLFPTVWIYFLPTLGLWPLYAINNQILSQIWYSWTPKALMIPKMYNTMGIWPTHQQLLSWKPIATLRWNENWWFEIYTRSVQTLKNIWLPDFQLKYLENEERYEFAVCGKWKNEESYTKRFLAKTPHFELNMSRKITLKIEHFFVIFKHFAVNLI